LEEVYDEFDEDIFEGEPLMKIDFEFECYSLNKEILKELILDEIILSNSKEARKGYRRI